MIYVDEQSKQQLDRSSQSVIDGYKIKFRLSNSNLQALKDYLYKMQDNVEELRKIMDDQVLVVKEQLDDATDIANNLCQNGDALIDTIEDLETGLDDIEDDLSDLEKEIEDELGCLAINDGFCTDVGQVGCVHISEAGQTCTSGCEISQDCMQTGGTDIYCNESTCGTAMESCAYGLSDDGCESYTQNTGCSSTSQCDFSEADIVTCSDIKNAGNETNCGYYVQYSYCVTVEQDGSGHCYTPRQMGCSTVEANCLDSGLAGCTSTGETNSICVMHGLDQCTMTDETNCTAPGQDGCGYSQTCGYSQEWIQCNQPGQDGCTLTGQTNCEAAGETNPLCSYYGLNNCFTGEYCYLNGLAGCSAEGEAGCMYFGQAGGCSTATVSACGTDFGSCMSVTLCGPAYGEAAECGGGEGCGWVQTCGSTCDGGETCTTGEDCGQGTCTSCVGGGLCGSCEGACQGCLGNCQSASLSCENSLGCTNNEGCSSNLGCTGSCQSTAYGA